MSKAHKFTAADKDRSLAHLRKLIKRGGEIQALCTSYSRSGMTRRYKFYVVKGGELLHITWSVAAATGYSYRDGEIIVGGYGFDGADSVRHDLSAAIHGGYKVKQPRRAGKPDYQQWRSCYTITCRRIG